jgi:hypothetical protein
MCRQTRTVHRASASLVMYVFFVAQSAASSPAIENYSMKPPFTAEEFWTKVLALIGEQNGYVTKERFESVFKVQFGSAGHESHSITYTLHQGHDWYFDARISDFDKTYTTPINAVENGAHSELVIVWAKDSFGDPDRGECVTANLVRTSLVAGGWTSPWAKWGAWEEMAALTAEAAGRRPSADRWYPPEPLPPPISSFLRQADADAGHRDGLPRGRVDTTGDFPNSCVTGIYLESKP